MAIKTVFHGFFLAFHGAREPFTKLGKNLMNPRKSARNETRFWIGLCLEGCSPSFSNHTTPRPLPVRADVDWSSISS